MPMKEPITPPNICHDTIHLITASTIWITSLSIISIKIKNRSVQITHSCTINYFTTAVFAPCTVIQPCLSLASASFILISSGVMLFAISLFASASAFAFVISISASFCALIRAVAASTFAVSCSACACCFFWRAFTLESMVFCSFSSGCTSIIEASITSMPYAFLKSFWHLLGDIELFTF